MHIRPATSDDCNAICAIWNPVIRDSDATFDSVEKTPEILMADLAARQRAGHPFLVVCDGHGIAGFATFGRFRASVGYRHTMEHTIILAPHARGRGRGRALLERLEGQARAAGAHSMFAGISHVNMGAIAFHGALGYRQVARLPEVGFKFDRWYDLVLMQKML